MRCNDKHLIAIYTNINIQRRTEIKTDFFFFLHTVHTHIDTETCDTQIDRDRHTKYIFNNKQTDDSS